MSEQNNIPVGAEHAVATQQGLTKGTLEAADNLRRHWTGDRVALDAAMKSMGIGFAQDRRNPAEKAFDENFSPPENGNYRLNYLGRNMGDPTELAAFNGEANTMLQAMQVPVSIGQGVLDAMLDSAARYSRLNEAEKPLYEQGQDVLLGKIGHKIGDASTIRKLAALSLSKADRGFVEALARKGGLESAEILLHLALQGQRLIYRSSLSKQGQ